MDFQVSKEISFGLKIWMIIKEVGKQCLIVEQK
jgi:uncharacterized protein YlaN (UPF0358 family)